jgi:hypothetical protein
MPNSNLRDRLETAQMVIGVVLSLYLVYMFCPGVQERVSGWWSRAIGSYRAQRAEERARNQMAWETFMVKNADPSRLAEDLEVNR